MRSFLIAVTSLMLLATGAAQANVSILVDKDAQMLTVAVDGVQRYQWPVSTGNPSHETPNGTFRAFRMEADHFSKEFDDAPMPHSIFFTKIGHAIHGTVSEGYLGSPVSHGCVRLSRAHAATLYALVQEQGVLNTTVTLTGSSQVALARNPRGRAAIARAEAAQQPEQQYQPQYQQQYSAPGQPMVLTPQVQYFPGRQPLQQQQLQQRADDGYIYPADGSSTDQRYPAPRNSRRVYDNGQVYYQQQPGYYQQQQQQPGYYQQQGYDNSYYAPQARSYQQRGLY